MSASDTGLSSPLVFDIDLSGFEDAIPSMGADEARSAIDTQVAKLLESVRALRSLRNSRAPISKIPSEILAHTFHHYHDPSLHVSRPNKTSQFYDDARLHNITWKQFIRVARICRTWRSVLFDHPYLWSRPIFSSSKRVVEEMFMRSKASPLSLRFSDIEINSIHTAALVARFSLLLASPITDAKNLGQLHISLSSENALREVLNLTVGLNAACLESLLIRNRSASALRGGNAIPPHLFSNDMPHLRHLDIRHCIVQWSSLCSMLPDNSELTSLTLNRVQPKPSQSQFLGLLSRASKLETLHLEACLPDFALHSLGGEKLDREVSTVRLSRLSSCTIKGSPLSQCVAFHACVLYPATLARVHFCPEPERATHGPWKGSMAVMYDRPLVLSLIDSLGLSVHNSSSRRSHASLLLEFEKAGNDDRSDASKIVLFDRPPKSASGAVALQSDEMASPSVTLDLTLPQNNASNRSEYGPIPWLDLSIPGLTQLFLRKAVKKQYSTDAWYGFLKRHPKITTMHIYCSPALPFFSALGAGVNFAITDPEKGEQDAAERCGGTMTASSIAQEVSVCLCPNLLAIRLERYGKDLSKEEYAAGFDAITRYLTERRIRGIPVQELSLSECYFVDKGSIEKLRGEVEMVKWDGRSLLNRR